MQSIGLVRDERATPLFAYILGHVDHRGALAPVYLRAIESLGALRDPGGIAPLRDALYKGEWWAPRRTGALRDRRGRGAGAHRHAGRARRARRGGRRSGSRGVRSAARAQLANIRAAAAGARAGSRRRMSAPRFQLADELLRRLAASLRSAQLYSPGHPIIGRNLESLSAAFQMLHGLQPTVIIGLVGDEVIVDDMPMAKADTLGPFVRRLQQAGVERITVERGVTLDEITAFLAAITTIDARDGDAAPHVSRRSRTSASGASPSSSASRAA